MVKTTELTTKKRRRIQLCFIRCSNVRQEQALSLRYFLYISTTSCKELNTITCKEFFDFVFIKNPGGALLEWLLDRYTPVPFPSGCDLMAVDEVFLPPARQETTISANNPGVRYRSKVDCVLGHLLRHKGYDIRNFQLKKFDNGKPYGLIEGRRMGVGIAHCRSMLVCAVNVKGETGIDVEPCKRSIHPGLRNRISHPGEHLALPADLCSIRLWTIKEAVLKFLGTGLRLAMNNIRLDMLNEHLFRAELESGVFTVTSFSFREHWISVVFDSCNLNEAPSFKNLIQ